MKIININGPINSGKTTISKLLQEKLPQSLFIEVDDLLSDDEQVKLKLTREQGWAERLQRLDAIIVQEKNLQRYENIIFAYPMTDKTYHQWKLWEDENTKFINITLAPNIDICLQNRGTRKLTEGEKARIRQMYQEGYHCSKFADLIINNSLQPPQETLQKILNFLCLNIRRATIDDAYDIKKIHIETYQKSYRRYLPDKYLDNMPLNNEIIERTKKYLQETKEKGELLIHPIPLLTASSNGRGGGDYKGINMKMVGYWCGDVLEVIDKEELNTIKGYTDILDEVYFEEV